MRNLKTIVVLLSFILIACEQDTNNSIASAPVESPDSGPAKMYFYGDEITKGDHVTASYPSIVSQTTGMEAVNRAYSHISGSSVSGSTGIAPATLNNTVGSWSDIILADIRPIDIIVILVGYNDVRWGGAPSNSTNYDTFFTPFLSAAYNTGAQIYVLTPPKMHASAYGQAFTVHGTDFDRGSDAGMLAFKNALINSVASFNSSGVKIVDIQSVFNPIVSNLTADLQWPNDNGHAVIAQKLLTEMGY